jgi:5-methylcytosine-specific restriction endonuclease McrA
LRGTHADRAPELDHILPLAAGGDHTFDNVACACRKCNQAKGALPLGQIRLTFAASAVAVMQAV